MQLIKYRSTARKVLREPLEDPGNIRPQVTAQIPPLLWLMSQILTLGLNLVGQYE